MARVRLCCTALTAHLKTKSTTQPMQAHVDELRGICVNLHCWSEPIPMERAGKVYLFPWKTNAQEP